MVSWNMHCDFDLWFLGFGLWSFLFGCLFFGEMEESGWD